jgi:membrane-bound lytic murein transglycosylase
MRNAVAALLLRWTLVVVIGMLAFVVVGSLLAGCKAAPEQRPDNVKTPTTGETTSLGQQVTNAENVKALCDFFQARSLATLEEPEIERRAKDHAMAQGIRPELRRAVDDYYKDHVKVSDQHGTETLTERYKRVLDQCIASGWKP